MTRSGTRWRRYGRWVALAGLVAACQNGSGYTRDGSGLIDLGIADQSPGNLDATTSDATPDATPGDGGNNGPDLTPGDVPIAQGSCAGRATHACTSILALYRTSSGALELRFPSNFNVSTIPAGEVYLSSRSALGSSINPNGTSTDVFLGTLQGYTGAQTYAVPAGADVGRPYAWIWCRRLTVEVGVAQLVPLP